MAIYPVRYRLPTAYATEIGRIITRYAFLEHHLRAIAYGLLSVSVKQGRIAVRDPRAADYITMFEDLIALEGLAGLDIATLKKRLIKLEGNRDLLAHGMWVKHGATRTPVVQGVRGRYNDPVTGERMNAKADPRAWEISIAELKALTRLIDKTIRELTVFAREVSNARRAALRRKSHAAGTRRIYEHPPRGRTKGQ
jgi:hypothetical protein